jgi:hypothetical protein
LAAYEAEQAALAAWERDNARYLEEQARKEREEVGGGVAAAAAALCLD